MAKILVVEDEEHVMKLLQMLLSAYGHQVLPAANGDEALQTLDSDAVDMLITDVNMPGMDGRDLAAQILASTPDLPTIFVSGDPSLNAETVARLPNTFCIRKPFTLAEVGEAVERMLG